MSAPREPSSACWPLSCGRRGAAFPFSSVAGLLLMRLCPLSERLDPLSTARTRVLGLSCLLASGHTVVARDLQQMQQSTRLSRHTERRMQLGWMKGMGVFTAEELGSGQGSTGKLVWKKKNASHDNGRSDWRNPTSSPRSKYPGPPHFCQSSLFCQAVPGYHHSLPCVPCVPAPGAAAAAAQFVLSVRTRQNVHSSLPLPVTDSQTARHSSPMQPSPASDQHRPARVLLPHPSSSGLLQISTDARAAAGVTRPASRNQEVVSDVASFISKTGTTILKRTLLQPACPWTTRCRWLQSAEPLRDSRERVVQFDIAPAHATSACLTVHRSQPPCSRTHGNQAMTMPTTYYDLDDRATCFLHSRI